MTVGGMGFIPERLLMMMIIIIIHLIFFTISAYLRYVEPWCLKTSSNNTNIVVNIGFSTV